VKVAELAPAELEGRAAEARLRHNLDVRPVADLTHERVDRHASVQFGVLECLNAHGRHDASSSALEVKADVCFHRAVADLLTIGELSARSGVASSALRFYEERGLISSERASSGHRRFARPVIRRVAFIVFAQRVGLSLDEIRDELVKLPADRAPNRGDWAKLSSSWSGRIDARIAELERLKEGLTDCIGCGCLSLGRCQLANPGDRAAARGPGPRYWIGDPRP